WNSEIKMMPGAPGQRLATQICQHELARERKRAEAVADLEFVLERIRLLRAFVRHEHRIEARLADFRQSEGAVSRKAMHRHRPHVSRRIAPALDLAVVEGPAGERKEDRIPPAHACDVADLLQVRPVN